MSLPRPLLYYTDSSCVGVVTVYSPLFAPRVSGVDGEATLFVAMLADGAGSLIEKSIVLGPTALPFMVS